MAVNNDPDFPVTTPGGRKVDVPVDLDDGTTMAVEVKMYQQYRTISLPDGGHEVQHVEVPLRSEIREQINKDVALRNADPTDDPRWSFLGAGPSPARPDYLTKAGIIQGRNTADDVVQRRGSLRADHREAGTPPWHARHHRG
ncbi:hypothetical protein AB0368_38215 [Actinoplanes sp. NPDC051475]|uniref:hypothetical protein n=1 Tax=Actinoplanes sp. NPDC051475 TaxID=3157225 RepID=UPI00344E1545